MLWSCAGTLTVFGMLCTTSSMAKSKMGYALPDAGSRSVWAGASARKRGFDDTVQQSNEEAGQNQPGVFAFKLQGLSFELHNPDAAKENPRPMLGSFLCLSNGAARHVDPGGPCRRDLVRTITTVQQITTDHAVRLLSHLTQQRFRNRVI